MVLTGAMITTAAASGAGGGGSLKTVATVASIAASAAAAYSSYQQGQTAEKIAEAGAAQGRLDAVARREKAQFDIERQRTQVRKLKGSQKVSLLASGVTLEGTALDILADTEVQAALDENIIRYNAESAARGLETSANISLFEGKEAATAGKIQAGSSLLSSSGKFAADKQKRKDQADLLTALNRA